MAKVVLAYSGGLDTSVCVRWLKQKGLTVLTYSANLGQCESLEPLGERALNSGATSAHMGDLRRRFVEEYIWPAVRAGAMYGDGYLLATALGRPLIAFELVRLAVENGSEYIAHGCTGKGNDQVRFETSVAALAPHVKIIAPLREWDLKTREEEIEFAKEHRIEIPVTRESPYSYDCNLWGVSIECGRIEDPWEPPPDSAYLMTKSPAEAPDKPDEVAVRFEEGLPVALDGEKLGGVELITRLNELGGEHGVGRLDVVEDRLVGIKSREVYEAPAATIIFTAHRALEAMTLTRDLRQLSSHLSAVYGRLVYYGLYFSEMREALDAYFLRTQRHVSGEARVRLYKGSCVVTGRRSGRPLYDKSLATYDVGDLFDHTAAAGFIKLWSLPLKVEAARARKVEKEEIRKSEK